MARSRTIKPSFFMNEELAELPFEARLLFVGLWTLADREGRLEDKPKRIKAQLFPWDSCDVDELLGSLAGAGFIARYEAEGVRCIEVLNFSKHQNVHPREAISELPGRSEPRLSTASNVTPNLPSDLGGKAADLGRHAPIKEDPEGEEDPEGREDPEGKEEPLPDCFNPKSQCLSTGRYALRDYPFVFIHPWELKEARATWEAEGLSEREWELALKRCNSELEAKRGQRDFSTKGFRYLTSHILRDALDVARKRRGSAGATRRVAVADQNVIDYFNRYGEEA